MKKSSDKDEEEEKQPEVSFLETKCKINMYSKKQFQSLSSVLIDAYYLVKSENNQLMDEYASLRLDCMTLKDQITSHNNTINGLKEQVKTPELSHKDKNSASELQLALEEEIKQLTINCQILTERNRLLLENLVKTKLDLE